MPPPLLNGEDDEEDDDGLALKPLPPMIPGIPMTFMMMEQTFWGGINCTCTPGDCSLVVERCT